MDDPGFAGRMDQGSHNHTEPHDVKGASAMVRQRVMRGDGLLVEAHVRVAFISGGRARPIPKPLRIAMKADQDAAQA
jgi:acyl-CoA thioester hydrolase